MKRSLNQLTQHAYIPIQWRPHSTVTSVCSPRWRLDGALKEMRGSAEQAATHRSSSIVEWLVDLITATWRLDHSKHESHSGGVCPLHDERYLGGPK